MARNRKQSGSESLLDVVPPKYRERFTEIVGLTDDFCQRFLDDEYRDMCRKMTAGFCQKGSPVLRGKPASWASGIVYAVGKVNFLTDPSFEPFMKYEDVAEGLGVSPATLYSKGSTIWNGLELMQSDPDFTLPSRADRNLLIWMLTVNGVLMDIRNAPREAQVVAFENGLIPYIPADRENGE